MPTGRSASSRSPARRLAEFDEFTNTIDLIAPDAGIARQYAAIRSELRSRGLLIPDNDCWIAATALARDLTLVTRDEHFSRVPSLKLHEPA
jgi:tRNA(fMet)-specific endonuclease VapC